MGRRVLAGVVAWCALAPACALAGDVAPRGAIVIRWASNPQTCEGYGLCGRSGTLSWRPHTTGGAFETRGEGYLTDVLFVQSPATARSRRETANGPRVCVEASDGPVRLEGFPPRGSRRARLAPADARGFGFGRCAGPLASEIEPALPRSAPFRPDVIARRGGTIDMRGTEAFSAGPFSGAVESSLVLRISKEQSARDASTHARVAAAAATHRRTHRGELVLDYSIESIGGEFGFGFTGARDAVCEILDTCDLRGELTIGGGTTPGMVRIDSLRDLARGRRESAATALHALRAGSSQASVSSWFGEEQYASPPVQAPLPVTERSGIADEPGCSDHGQFLISKLEVAHAPTGFTLSLPGHEDEPPGSLRTHCPGPVPGDLPAQLAAGVLPRAVLGDKLITVSLRPATGLQSLAFNGSGRGQLDVTLRLAGTEVKTL